MILKKLSNGVPYLSALRGMSILFDVIYIIRLCLRFLTVTVTVTIRSHPTATAYCVWRGVLVGEKGEHFGL